MGCFCHASMAPLTALLTKLHPVTATPVTAAPPPMTAAQLPGAEIAQAVAGWLAARGLPAAPWTPDPAWLTTPLPKLQLGMHEVATISALAQLRAQARTQLGLDLLHPVQARAFARVVATLNARMTTLAQHPAVQGFSPHPWTSLAHLNSAIDQVQAALKAGVLVPSQTQIQAFSLPGGQPMARWTGFLAQLRKLAPMVAASSQLQVALSDTTQLAAILRSLARLALPPLAAPQLMGSVTAALAAMARLQESLGVPLLPTRPGGAAFPGGQTAHSTLAALTAQVQAKLNAMLKLLASSFGLRLAGANPAAVLAQVRTQLPNLPMVPTTLATAPVVHAALSAQALEQLAWKVPASLPATHIGLPACAFAAQMQASFQAQPVLAKPCGSGCDAAKLMQATEQLISA